MLNGGISSSAIFMAGQVRPQARLTADQHEAGRRCRQLLRGGWHGGASGRGERGGQAQACVAPVRAAAQAVGTGKRPASRDISSCCTAVGGVLRKPRDFRGVSGRAGVLHEITKFHLKFKGLAPTVRGGAEPAELPQEQTRRGRRRDNRIRHGGPLRDRAVRARARSRMRIDAVKADLDRFDALIAESADLRAAGAQPGVPAEEQTQGARRGARQGRHRRARRQFPQARRVQPAAVRGARHDPRLPRAGRHATRARSPPRSPSPRRRATRISPRSRTRSRR